MSKPFNINRYVREESKSISISVPLSQYAIIEKLASITHRTVNDVASVIFIDHTFPQIRAVLEGKEQPKGTKRSQKAALPTAPQPSVTGEDASPELKETLPIDPKPTLPPQLPQNPARSDPQPASSMDKPSIDPLSNPPQPRPRPSILPPTQPPSPSSAAPNIPPTPNMNPGSPK